MDTSKAMAMDLHNREAKQQEKLDKNVYWDCQKLRQAFHQNIAALSHPNWLHLHQIIQTAFLEINVSGK